MLHTVEIVFFISCIFPPSPGGSCDSVAWGRRGGSHRSTGMGKGAHAPLQGAIRGGAGEGQSSPQQYGESQ